MCERQMAAEAELGLVTSLGREWMLQGMIVAIGGGFRSLSDGDGLHHLQDTRLTKSRKADKELVNCIATICAQGDI